MAEKLTIKDCYTLLEKYKTPTTVVRHSESVAKISYLLGKKLAASGKKIDIKSLVYAGILHDVFKIIDIEDYTKHLTPMEVEAKKPVWDSLKKKFEGKDHEEAFFLEFSQKYPKVAMIAAKHKYSQINEGLMTWEERIVYYADKLVMFDMITSLNERLKDARERYSHKFSQSPANKKYVEETNRKIEELEKELLKLTGLKIEDIIKLNSINFKKMIEEDFSGEM